MADGGVGAVTTRAVAASADTSIPAVHELFGGKGGLVRAMFAEGFDVLAGDLAALETTGDAEQDLLELVWAFRRFAVGRSQLFDVMFSRPFAEFRPGPDDLRASETIYQVVMHRVGAVLGPSTPARVRKDAAIGLFGVVQGLANLELAGILGSARASIDRRWRTTVLATVNGLRAPLTTPTADPLRPERT